MLPIGSEVKLSHDAQRTYRIKPTGIIISYNKRYRTYRIKCILKGPDTARVLYFNEREIDNLNPSHYTDDLDNWV